MTEGAAPPDATEAARSPAPAATADIVPVRALLLGERLDTRALERGASVGIAPLTLDIPGGGVVVLFRYGAVVLFGPANAAMDEFVAKLMPSIAGAFPAPEREEARLLIRAESDQHVDASGNIILRDRDRALDRKLDIVSRTVETLLGLVQTRSSLRVEWYIVLLIVAELVLSLYPLLLRR